jgi:hypothetical protein
MCSFQAANASSRSRAKLLRVGVLGLAVLSVATWTPCIAQSREEEIWVRLPSALKMRSLNILKECEEMSTGRKTNLPWRGITIVDLSGDGSHDVIWDAYKLCGSPKTGANCDKWDTCPFEIWKQVQRTQWQRVFSQMVRDEKFLSITDNVFKFMSIQIHGRNPYCRVDTTAKYPACDVTLRWSKGKFTK